MPTSFKQHIKIACIGCSYTEGLRANEIKSYPFLLYKKLKQDHNKKVEVYNCGVGGSGAKVHKHIFEYVRNIIKPDIIVHQITDSLRTEISNDKGEIKYGFYTSANTIEEKNAQTNVNILQNDYESDNEPNYYYIRFDTKNWTVLPIILSYNLDNELPWTGINPFAKKQISPDGDTNRKTFDGLENLYVNYIKSQNTLTFQQFKNFCLYKNYVERYSVSNQLDYIADVDYILNCKKPKKFSFFWLEESKKEYNTKKQDQGNKEFKGTDIESMFKQKKKSIKNYSLDDYLHLNSKGHDIVADWIIEELINQGKLKI